MNFEHYWLRGWKSGSENCGAESHTSISVCERERTGGSLGLADYRVQTTSELQVQREILSEENG